MLAGDETTVLQVQLVSDHMLWITNHGVKVQRRANFKLAKIRQRGECNFSTPFEHRLSVRLLSVINMYKEHNSRLSLQTVIITRIAYVNVAKVFPSVERAVPVEIKLPSATIKYAYRSI